MKYVHLLFDLVFGLIDKMFNFAMLHMKLCLVLWVFWIIFIIFVNYMANNGKIFGFWWQLNRGLDNFVNNGLIITSILLALELMITGMLLLSMYKGL